ncbi:MAG: glycerol kinase [Ponticaulis sp.]|nr:glycerol kinase [Ponticaulis sp.]
MSKYILVIDEGTTSTRAIAFDHELTPVFIAQEEIPLSFPQEGWVEQDAEQIWSRSILVCKRVIRDCGGADQIAAIAITNQRETTLMWDRETGDPFGPAIIWQDRRTSAACQAMKDAGQEKTVQALSGLLIDPYFSATKIRWILENFPAAAKAVEQERAAFGTVDSYLLARLTTGSEHATDVTNASRTALMDLSASSWSRHLCDLFDVPWSVLPSIGPSGGEFGVTDKRIFGKAIPVLSMIGDQQAALVGHACTQKGDAKITYGTGAFLVANTGMDIPVSGHRLLATSAFQAQGKANWALEGSIFNAGTVVKWLRDELGLISQAADTEAMAAELTSNGGVYFVPAFTGLGAPHWKPDARGQITGLSRGTRAAHIVRAGLEASAYQTLDLLTAFEKDGCPVDVLRVDGGMAANDWLMQFLADITQKTVERPVHGEMTALGAAVLAAGELGWMSLGDWRDARKIGAVFEPRMSDSERDNLVNGWNQAISRAI